MFANPSYKPVHLEGPYLNWKGKNELQFTYLEDGSAKSLPVQVGEEEVVRIQSPLREREDEYVVRRNPQPPPARQKEVEKVLVLGDIHGTYGKLRNFLEKNSIIDKEGHWRWGHGQLVFSGDVLDRGTEVTESLWLIYRLEQEAAEAGGAVHYLLGNHELMVMEGDYRYVNEKYRKLYARAGRVYGEQFAEDGVFGQWLRSRNAVIQLNELLISHAGISPAVAKEGLSIEEINRQLRDYLQNKPIADRTAHLLTGQQGPLWYRGYFMALNGYGQSTQEEVDSLLAQYGAAHMSVAHTTVDSVQTRYKGKVFAVDLDLNDRHTPFEGLLYKESAYFRLGEDGSAEKL